jgi:hypothetical protein
MQFRYDFVGDKLDLSRFIKQINRHLIQYDVIEYSFYVLAYKIQANIFLVEGTTKHAIKFFIAELQRDDDGEVSSYTTISITEDLRFKEFPDLIKHYLTLSTVGEFESSSVDEIINILSTLIKVIYKINNLKAFL